VGAFFIQGKLPGRVWSQPGGATGAVGVVPGDLLGEQEVGGREIGDGGGAEQGDEAVLKSAKAALDFALGLRVRGDAVGDAQAEQRALELRTHIIRAGVRHGTEERKTVGVIGARGTVGGDGDARAGEVGPGRLVGHEGAGDDLARVIIDG